MGIPDHFTCLLKNLYSDQEAAIRADMEQRTGSKLGKEYNKGLVPNWERNTLSPCLSNFFAEWKWKVKVKVTHLCLTLWAIVHGILQARLLKWVAFSFSRGSSQTRDWTQVSCLAGRFFTNWATITWNVGLDEVQIEIKIARRNINNLRYEDDTTLMAENEELKSLLMEVKKEIEKAGLKLNIQKMKIRHLVPSFHGK